MIPGLLRLICSLIRSLYQKRECLSGEYKYTGKVVQYFTANYRACIGACVAGQGDVMIGAAALMARANGLSMKSLKINLLICLSITKLLMVLVFPL